MKRPPDINWMRHLTTSEKSRLNALVSCGCHVVASTHDEATVRVFVRFRGRIVADETGEQLGPVFDQAYGLAWRTLFGREAELRHG